MGDLEELVSKMDESPPQDDFLVYGNPSADFTLVFEKQIVFEAAFEIVQKDLEGNFLLVCTKGIPSKECIDFLKHRKGEIFYLGDLDPLSIYTYLILKMANLFPKLEDEVELQIKYIGLRKSDYRNLMTKSVLIKIPEIEMQLLEKLKGFGILSEEIEFLSDGYKVEADFFSRGGLFRFLMERLDS